MTTTYSVTWIILFGIWNLESFPPSRIVQIEIIAIERKD